MTNVSVRCESCTTEVHPTQLQLSLDGQWLCRTCHGHYMALQATRQARRAAVFRRCRCGSVLAPMGDSEIKPVQENGVNLEFVFQPSVYRCPCGVQLRTDHAAILCLFALAGVLFTGAAYAVAASGKRADDAIGLAVVGVGFLGYVVHKVIVLARYPRVE
jgi:hypothetical protein